MKKRGQVTIFIIVGLLILAAFVLFMAFQDAEKTTKKEEMETTSIKNYVESVLDRVVHKAIIKVSKQGGEFAPSDYETFQMDGHEVRAAYGLKNNNNIISRDKTEIEICRAVEANMAEEVDLSFLDKKGIKYQVMEDSCSASINKNSVTVDYTMPLNLSRGRAKGKLENFKSTTNVNLNDVINLANFLIGKVNTGKLNVSEKDFSCEKMRACYEDGIIKIMQYEPWEKQPGLRFNFAVDREVNGTCSKLERINNNNC